MAAPVRLTYHDDDEGITVRVASCDPPSAACTMIVHTNDKHVATLIAPSLGQARDIARLLVGIELQPDGAAWKRGPRPPAQPTEAGHEG